ncbi:MAG: nucleoside deaminase [Candidatus Amulumruptor caecigallinarius]|nr:nucleoside deaminase [Candidatus Amulumruptor caecigallinarius]
MQDLSLKADERYMQMALEEATAAYKEGEIPVGAVIVGRDGRVLARDHNRTERLTDVTAHAEMLALTSAFNNLGGKYLPGCTIYVTVEPCTMCAGALGWSQIGRIVYGAPDVKRGFFSCMQGAMSPIHPKTTVQSGVLEDECRMLMIDFFKRLRR